MCSVVLREVRRVLKPNGVAIFREPIEVPSFDRVRNSRLGRWLVPNGVSFKDHITTDERKLTAADMATIRTLFPVTEQHRFAFLSRFNRFIAKRKILRASTLDELDRRLLRAVPLLRNLGGCVVLVLRKS